MDRKMLGRMLGYERSASGFTGKMLVQGICSVSALKRLEAGERSLEFFAIQRLTERLGRSVNKLEILYDEEFYELFAGREYIEALLDEKRYDEALQELRYYEMQTETKGRLHLQYIKGKEAVIAAERDGDDKKAAELLSEALELTANGFSVERIEDFAMGEEELILLMMLLKERERITDCDIEVWENFLFPYIEKRVKDEEVKANIFSKAFWILGEGYMKRGEYEKALEMSLKGEEILTKNGLLIHLPQFLERIVLLTEGRRETVYTEYKKMKDALREVYDTYGFFWAKEVKLWKRYLANDIYLISELLKEERNMAGLSQEDLAEKIQMDSKTISRIERGKAKPKAGTLQKIKACFDIDRDLFSTRIVTEDFEALEMEREIAKLLVYDKEHEAEALYLKLKSRLSPKYRENRQCIALLEAIFDRRMGRKNDEETLSALKDAYSITRGKDGMERLGEYVPRRMEAMIINNISICLEKLGRKEEGILYLEKVIKSYEGSKVELKHHYVSVSILYENLAYYYEETGRYEEALQILERLIPYGMSLGRANRLGILIEEKSYTEEKFIGDRTYVKEAYRNSYRIMKLMRISRKRIGYLRSYFKEQFGEDID